MDHILTVNGMSQKLGTCLNHFWYEPKSYGTVFLHDEAKVYGPALNCFWHEPKVYGPALNRFWCEPKVNGTCLHCFQSIFIACCNHILDN